MCMQGLMLAAGSSAWRAAPVAAAWWRGPPVAPRQPPPRLRGGQGPPRALIACPPTRSATSTNQCAQTLIATPSHTASGPSPATPQGILFFVTAAHIIRNIFRAFFRRAFLKVLTNTEPDCFAFSCMLQAQLPHKLHPIGEFDYSFSVSIRTVQTIWLYLEICQAMSTHCQSLKR